MRYYGYGILVVLQHPDNIETYYSHLSKAIVNPGDTVLPGIPIGLGGRTGRATTNHLHFEIRKDKKALNAEKLFDFENQIVRSWVIERKPDKVKKESVIFSNEKDTLNSEMPQVEPIYHKIKKGDTLYSLAKRYGTTVDSICKTNGIRPKSVLKIGTRLKMN
jgi:murein DD-endopeptidase MepM/ murein hydrolase activator NlpD